MIPETVQNARYVEFYEAQGNRRQPYLVVELDGQDVVIPDEQKLLERYGVVTFTQWPGDPDNEADLRYEAILPEEAWRGPQKVKAATADPRVVQLTRRYLHDLDTNNWQPGRRLDL